jgi:hypothetical protein
MDKNIFLVGGTWDNEQGKPSGYVQKLAYAIEDQESEGDCNSFVYLNGGNWDYLKERLEKEIKRYNIIIWMPNISNDEEKIVKRIKEINPKCILVISKNNYDKKYSYQELIARMLDVKANLMLEITRDLDRFHTTILDPLGNIYGEIAEDDIDIVAEWLVYRLDKLRLYSIYRAGSESIGDVLRCHWTEDRDTFVRLVRNKASTFHKLIHGTNTTRFLGNSSFRCEHGFPSVRGAEKIFVSRRNIDKRDIDLDHFVACEPYDSKASDKVLYHGEHKPSVDTPIQLRLYDYYKKINYMLHSHVYVQGAPFTNSKIPCGCILEAYEVISTLPWPDATSFTINLKGHGSLVARSYPISFAGIDYVARAIPEK